MSDQNRMQARAALPGSGCPFHRGVGSAMLSKTSSGNLVRPHGGVGAAPSSRSAQSLTGDNGPVASDFFRMFPDLAPSLFNVEDLRLLTLPGGPMDVANLGVGVPQDNPTIPAGYTFLGQFLDHDLTFDVYSDINGRDTQPNQTRNAITPTLDLGNVYGRGPVQDAFLFDQKDGATLLFGRPDNPDGDVLRNVQGTAIIGDPRNDDNMFVDQLQLAFIKFHNQVVKDLKGQFSGGDLFTEAAKRVRWHYQWIVYHDFVRRFVGDDLYGKLVDQGPQYFPPNLQQIPIEFSAAAYRMGHATIRELYQVNASYKNVQIFDLHQPGTFLSPEKRVDWKYFFNTDASVTPQGAKLFDTVVASELLQLPEALIPGFDHPQFNGKPDPLYLSLPGRNLLRQNEFTLPAGQTVADALGVTRYSNSQLGLPQNWASTLAPLWYYILKEAKLANQGRFLGPVGGRIVGETFFSVLKNDPRSFLHNKGWKPTYGTAGDFTIADLLRIADAYTAS
ncbi:peroxidase family protein [Corallococcus aberystwythensis]|uniref:Peroxidase n=1 Tax=Corallococcus aberystwythensis TaxID=2316722 RepID=A0A3A8QTS9_9BACT|nr:peroxidase family protein [Corallococcus aberystwythensis]RKH71281.1 peroxidase [Corallococcus aberystwythensis]